MHSSRRLLSAHKAESIEFVQYSEPVLLLPMVVMAGVMASITVVYHFVNLISTLI